MKYEYCDMTHNEIAIAMINGEVFFSQFGERYYYWNGEDFVNNEGCRISVTGAFYKREGGKVMIKFELGKGFYID